MKCQIMGEANGEKAKDEKDLLVEKRCAARSRWCKTNSTGSAEKGNASVVKKMGSC